MPSSTSPAQTPVYKAFKDHCSGLRINTKLATIELLRSQHPNHHVTLVNGNNCDLTGFAAAGHAEARLLTEDNSYFLQRIYQAARGRDEEETNMIDEIDNNPNKRQRRQKDEAGLIDDVLIGRFDYTWKGRESIVYKFVWDNPWEEPLTFFFILSLESNSGVDGKGHDAKTDELVAACGKWTGELHEEVYVFDGGDWLKSHLLWKAVQGASWDDVILDAAMKKTLQEDVNGFFAARQIYEEYRVPWKRGIILHGSPGCGKTISIKALMNSLQSQNVASLYVKSFEGCGQEKPQSCIRRIFSRARDMAPCLLIFEDLDSLVVNEVRSYFLNEVDGLDDNNGILMIGSTNHLARLDPGIAKRPSRFDRKYHYRLPDRPERILYAEYWQRKLASNKAIDFPDELCGVVADWTEEFSFAYLKELFVQVLLAFIRGGEDNDNDDEENDGVEKSKEEEIIDPPSLSGASNEDKEKKKDRVLTIPSHLESNRFLHIIRRQVKILVRDMDNTEIESPTVKAEDEEEEK